MDTEDFYFLFFCPDNESAPILFSYKRSLKKHILCSAEERRLGHICFFFSFFLSTITVFFQLLTHMNTKEDIVKNVGNQSVAGSHRYPYNGKTCYGSPWETENCLLCSKCYLLCSTEEKTHTILEKLEGEQMMAEFKCSYWLDPFVCLFKCGINRRVN